MNSLSLETVLLNLVDLGLRPASCMRGKPELTAVLILADPEADTQVVIYFEHANYLSSHITYRNLAQISGLISTYTA